MRHRPYFLRRRVRRLPNPCPSKSPRGWSTEWRNHSLCARTNRVRGASRRSICGFSVPGSAFPGLWTGLSFRPSPQFGSSPRRAWALLESHWPIPSPASSSRSGPNAARSAPGASRVRGYEPRPQAPHPLPPSRRLMRAPSDGEDKIRLYSVGINVKMALTPSAKKMREHPALTTTRSLARR